VVEFWIGLVGGILIGASGCGTGSLLTPLLILSGYKPAIAIGTGLGVSVVCKLSATFIHRWLGHWPGRAAWVLIASGVVGVALAASAGSALFAVGSPEADRWLRRLLAVTLLASAVGLLTNGNAANPAHLPTQSNHRTIAMLSGIGVGALMSLTSAGSGTVLVPILTLTTPWEVRQLAAASNVFGWVVGGMGLAFHLHLRSFDGVLFAKLLLGLTPGVVAGTLLSRRIKRPWFVRGTGLVALFLGTRLLLV